MPRNEELVYTGVYGEVWEYEPTPGKFLYTVRLSEGASAMFSPGRPIMGIPTYAEAVDLLDSVNLEDPAVWTERALAKHPSGIFISNRPPGEGWGLYKDPGKSIQLLWGEARAGEGKLGVQEYKEGGLVEDPSPYRAYTLAHEIGHAKFTGRIPLRKRLELPDRDWDIDYTLEEMQADSSAEKALGRSEAGQEVLRSMKPFLDSEAERHIEDLEEYKWDRDQEDAGFLPFVRVKPSRTIKLLQRAGLEEEAEFKDESESEEFWTRWYKDLRRHKHQYDYSQEEEV